VFCLFENVRFDDSPIRWMLLMSRVLQSLMTIHHKQWLGHQPPFQMTPWLSEQTIHFVAICCTWLFHHLCKLFSTFCFCDIIMQEFLSALYCFIIIIIIRLLCIKAAQNTLQNIKCSSSNKREEIKTKYNYERDKCPELTALRTLCFHIHCLIALG